MYVLYFYTGRSREALSRQSFSQFPSLFLCRPNDVCSHPFLPINTVFFQPRIVQSHHRLYLSWPGSSWTQQHVRHHFNISYHDGPNHLGTYFFDERSPSHILIESNAAKHLCVRSKIWYFRGYFGLFQGNFFPINTQMQNLC